MTTDLKIYSINAAAMVTILTYTSSGTYTA